MSDGFLERWSRRKLDARNGRPPPDEPPHEAAPQAEAAEAPVPAAAAVSHPVETIEIPPELPPPTLEDVKALTAESDFSRFAAREVAPEVKNAALKKLFADPRFNVMDGLDVYIDDYTKPDLLPGHMARQLAGAAFLKLFEEPAEAAPRPRDDADDPALQSVAQSGSDPAAARPHDADPDLRLQQDDAAGLGEPGPGAA